ncbi:MAG: hypothetical protein JRC87_07995 [Deltaproteobacteria bacterium]|nr:hypothetical protein [Deltaproteobacteria bacterium]
MKLNNQVLELIAKANDMLGGDYVFDRQYILSFCAEAKDKVQHLIFNLDRIAPNKYHDLTDAYYKIAGELNEDLAELTSCPIAGFIVPYSDLNRDFIEAVGGKNANLAELGSHLDISIPRGFAITTAAYYDFIKANNLQPKINRELELLHKDQIDIEQTAKNIQQLIMKSQIPARLGKEISHAVNQLILQSATKSTFFAVRSSAWGEDGERSFAGQYSSKLNVRGDDLKNQYRRVLASLYSENALAYRQNIGFDEERVAMSVACQEMIDGRVSGVLYTHDPNYPEKNSMLVSAAWGLGGPIVSGRISSDQYTVSRDKSHATIALNLVHKPGAMRLSPKGGTEMIDVDVDRRSTACLQTDQLHKLAEAGLLIERYFNSPQDIEFTFDQQGELIILQARRLTIQPATVVRPEELAELKNSYPVIMHNRGEVAQKGIGIGPVYKIKRDEDLNNFPAGAILVARFASPILAKVMPFAAGIITDIGSTTGHLATVAREFRVPCLLNTEDSTTILENSQEITLDTEENIIYQGQVKELQAYSFIEDDINETPEYRLLRRVLRRIEPLNLLDPAESNFTPNGCRTLHDITRFIHEKAVDELIDLSYYHNHDQKSISGKLVWDIPLNLVLIDIGGGLEQGVSKKITLDQITSIPMQALLAGLAHPKAWDSTPLSVDMGSFMSSLTKTVSPELSGNRKAGQNLAVISDVYANLNLQLGYHFTVIDTYLTNNINDNYAHFRFYGGVTESRRRCRRAKFLERVLESHDFRVEVQNDLVIASVKKIDKKNMLKHLHILGLLIGFTRQLDVEMVSEQSINDAIIKFNLLMEAVDDR